MKERVKLTLDCCDSDLTVGFDDADAPILAPFIFRTNVICPSCSRIVILTHRLQSDGSFQTHQEVID